MTTDDVDLPSLANVLAERLAEARARLSEVEAERDAAKIEAEHVRQRARWAAIYRANGRCRTCSGLEGKHRMSCRHYVGPLEHVWEEWQARINPTFGGTDHYCRCGGSCRVGGLAGAIESGPPVCPNADQTYRGEAYAPAAFARNYVPAELLHDAEAKRDQAIENGQFWHAEREAWRPVVEAAIAWRQALGSSRELMVFGTIVGKQSRAMVAAVDALLPGDTDG